MMKWIFFSLLALSSARAADLRVGAATVSITPDRPVALAGQFGTRVSKSVEAPVMAAVVALESVENGKPVEQAVFISCDLVGIHHSVLAQFREHLKPLIPELDVRKVIVSATHTHTAPVTSEIMEETLITYPIPKEGVMQPAEYTAFMMERLSQAVVKAWKERAPGGVSWTLGFAQIGENRRSVFADGHAEMYAKTGDARFRHLEAGADSGVETLFFWDANQKLMAVAVNIACPAQEVESRSTLNADFWHDAREQLRAKLNLPELTVLGWCSAAGDQSPHPQYRKEAEARMLKLRGLTRQQELGRRLAHAVADTLDAARTDIRKDAVLGHHVEDLALPPRVILEREYEDAKRNVTQYSVVEKPDNRVTTMLRLEKGIVERFEHQKDLPPYEMELHVLRLGDVALTTNTFELYLDWGVQMKARSPGQQTFVLQLTNGCGMYLPTELAIHGGSYSGLPHVNKVGPEAGQLLVDSAVRAMHRLFPVADAK
ncbi:hypothetical protein [Prosthecobacter sp.]|uniref:hypothetical protein n=1 Tax=Prosthecobacter sp. TaxID=1965333 RepID=UPI00378419F0